MKYSPQAMSEASFVARQGDTLLWRALRVGCPCGGYYAPRQWPNGRKFYACTCGQTMEKGQHMIVKAGTLVIVMESQTDDPDTMLWRLRLAHDLAPIGGAVTIKSEEIGIGLRTYWYQIRDSVLDNTTRTARLRS